MGSETFDLTCSSCPQCGEEKHVAVSIYSSCKECGLDALFMKYEIPSEKIRDVLTEIFTVLDKSGLRQVEGVSGIKTLEELEKRLNT